jgi:aminoglycoside phosphotransferase
MPHRIRPANEDLVVGHGDPCLAIALFDDHGRLTGRIDVGRGRVADRYNDLALATSDLAGTWHRAYGDRLLRRYGIEAECVDDTKIPFYRLLDEFF